MNVVTALNAVAHVVNLMDHQRELVDVNVGRKGWQWQWRVVWTTGNWQLSFVNSLSRQQACIFVYRVVAVSSC